MDCDPSTEVCPIDFREALERTAQKTRHLLLGNGFSIDARSSFSYASLFQAAGGFSPSVEAIFQQLRTQDFEEVLNHLAAEMSRVAITPEALDTLKAQDAEVRDGFVRALSTVHPASSTSLSDDECSHCAAFLENFVGTKRDRHRGKLFTTNYDLLLYWVLVRHGKQLKCYDGHISPVDNNKFGVWDEDKVPQVLYLHGGLHLYEHAGEQRMLRYDGQRRLIEQTRYRLDRGQFPIVVSEGTSAGKLSRIARSAYLQAARKAFDAALNRTAALFTLGHGLSERDDHFIRRVGSKRVGSVFIGAWGGLDSRDGEAARRWARIWWDRRGMEPKAEPLEVFVFDSSKFSVWRTSIA